MENNKSKIPYKNAIKMGIVGALLSGLYSVLVYFIVPNEMEGVHLLRYLIMAVVIGYGIHKYHGALPIKNRKNYAMVLGILIAVIMALGEMVFNFFFGIINPAILISDVYLPITDGFKFALIEMDLLMDAVVFGFLLSFISTFAFVKVE